MKDRAKTACFTGHRYIPEADLPLIKKILKKELITLIEKGVIYFGNGGAIGFDTLAADVVIKLRKKYPQIRLIMVLPCEEQDKYWNAQQKSDYKRVLSKANDTKFLSDIYYDSCMLDRNRHLVDYSGYCIAYLKHSKGGTAYTVNYAKKCGLEVINLAKNIKIDI